MKPLQTKKAKMKTIETKVYEYDELSDAAKAHARDWFRDCTAGDIDFAESVADDAETIAEFMGIEFAQRRYATNSVRVK
jgi:hypothetical protein